MVDNNKWLEEQIKDCVTKAKSINEQSDRMKDEAKRLMGMAQGFSEVLKRGNNPPSDDVPSDNANDSEDVN